ncbi:MAG: hypothetical protein MUC36_06565 [Planctomycetes bacterium]|nr:hypothetical protein [Planctomycetota bacterium]
MNPTRSRFAPCCLLLTSLLSAQVVYVDADASTNTTNADGTPLVPVVGAIANDNQWQQRQFANGGTILSSNDFTTGSEDCPMLRTTISGLTPTLPYFVYGYQWNTQVDQWRLRLNVDTQQPTAPLQLWHTRGSGSPMSTPLAFNAPSNSVANLGLQFDAAGMETSGHFANPVMIKEGNRWLFEVPLGTFTADLNGQIHVYVDDDPTSGNFNRNWYDGVGYEPAPMPYGPACGAGRIAFRGTPHGNSTISLDLLGSNPNSLGLLMIGLGSLPPFDVGAIGFTPGCFLNVNFAVINLAPTNASGDASWQTTLGPVPAGVTPLFFQWAVLDPALTLTSMTSGLRVGFHP